MSLSARLAFAISAAAFGSGFQHGWNTGVVNSPAEKIKSWITKVNSDRSNFRSSSMDEQVELETLVTYIWAVSVAIFCVGGAIGGALIGFTSDTFGRKGALLLNNIFVFLAVGCQLMAKPKDSYELLIAGRFFIGVNSGLNAGLASMYLTEISPTNLRGAIGSVYQLVITISILLSMILSTEKVMGTDDLWPYLLGLTLIPAVIQLVTLPFCPESPKYLLINRGRDEDAQKALKWLRGSGEVNDEMQSMRAEYNSMKDLPKVGMLDLFLNSSLRAPMFIAIMMMLAQQFSGINAIMFYSTKIFENAQIKGAEAQMATIIVGAVNVLMTIVSLVLVEKAGRKTLLLIGFVGMCIVTTLMAVCFWYTDHDAVKHFLVALVVIYIILFAAGAGSIPWFLVSELFNQSARPTATSIAVTTNWLANFVVGLVFLPLSDLIEHKVFFIFVVLQGLFAVYIWFKVPETKNKSIEEISNMFK